MRNFHFFLKEQELHWECCWRQDLFQLFQIIIQPRLLLRPDQGRTDNGVICDFQYRQNLLRCFDPKADSDAVLLVMGLDAGSHVLQTRVQAEGTAGDFEIGHEVEKIVAGSEELI